MTTNNDVCKGGAAAGAEAAYGGNAGNVGRERPGQFLAGADGLDVRFYDDQVPDFVERELERLYQCVMTTLARFSIYDAARNASTYVVRKDGEISTVLLFRRERNHVAVYNQQVTIDGEEIERFAQQVFARYKSVAFISFYAIEANTDTLAYPFQKRDCLEDIVATLPASPDAWLAGLGKNTRTSLKRYHNKILRDFPSFRFDIVGGDAVGEQQVRDIVAMSHARMTVKNQTCYHNEQTTQQLIRLVRKYGEVGIASTDGGICAGIICQRVGANYFMHVLAHDPAYDDYRLGKLCCYLSICNAIAHGAREYHFGWGRFDYKYKMSGLTKELYRIDIYRSRLRLVQNVRRVLGTAARAEIRRFRLWLARVELGESASERRLAHAVKTLRRAKAFLRGTARRPVP